MRGDVALRVLALWLPPVARARYLEEWRSDAHGAAEAGLRRTDVLRGAAMLTLTIDRDLPAHTGEPRCTVPRRFARRGLALFAAAAIVLAGSWITGGGIVPDRAAASSELLSTLSTASWISARLALPAALVGALYVGVAALVARAQLARIAFGTAVAGPVVIAVAALSEFEPFMLTLGVVLTLFGCALALVIVMGPSPLALERRTATRLQRLPVTIFGAAVVAAVLLIGAVDLLVWNPQAKVPGIGLDTIYGRMVADDHFQPLIGFGAVAVWAGFWGGLALIVVVLAAQYAQTWMTPRRVSILLLTIVGAAVFFRFFAGFSIGMSIADTWATSGMSASLASAVLPLVGQTALVAAVVCSGWAPNVHRAAVPAG